MPFCKDCHHKLPSELKGFVTCSFLPKYCHRSPVWENNCQKFHQATMVAIPVPMQMDAMFETQQAQSTFQPMAFKSPPKKRGKKQEQQPQFQQFNPLTMRQK